RVRQCEELGEYAMGEQIRKILIDEQDHQIALATALGKSVPPPRKPHSRPQNRPKSRCHNAFLRRVIE
ncbi:MAG TPA: hypothetical protein VGF01_18825, partial [Terracidiphilus sp.]